MTTDEKPAPILSPLQQAERDSICLDLREAVFNVVRHASLVKAPFTERQALDVGLALDDLRRLVSTWRPKNG